jgi:DNA invertase Pin-like site-specific DNA recombinase
VLVRASIGHRFERTLMSERTIDGLAAARGRGRTGGQKAKLGPRQVTLAWQTYDEKDQNGRRKYTAQQIADEFGVTCPTIYRHLTKPHPSPHLCENSSSNGVRLAT